MNTKYTVVALAVLALTAPAIAQTTAAATTAAPQRVEVTGSLIKRIDRTTPSVVQTITREEIRGSGYTTLSDLLRANGAVDTGSIGDGAASGFVGGLSTISLRGLGSQSTLILINSRRVAPVGAVDINFGRGSLVSVNTIPQGAIDRVEVVKDGASAMYGSDAMAGVINYILRKDYQGAEGTASYSANDKGKGATKSAGVTFGFGNIDTQRFNVFGGLEFSKRDSVMYSDIKDRGNQALYDSWNNQQSILSRFTPDSSASFYGNYYRVPTALTGSTVINGITVQNTNLSGANYLGTQPGCPDERTVGKGVPNRPAGFAATTAGLRDGFCRFNFDNADETIAAQDKTNAVVRGTFAISNNLTAFADLMFAQTKTTEKRIPYALTTTLVTSGNTTATTWPKIDGSFKTQSTIILPATHPDNPTRGTATAQPVQLIYRFEDLKLGDINDLKSTRLTAGVEGTAMGWDFESALLFNRQDNTRIQQDRVRSSLLNASIASGTYRFGGVNNDAAKASVASDALNTGNSDILSLDVRASREWFKMAGGNASIAVGAEVRREKLESVPDETYGTGDYIGLVANGASGTRNVVAAFTELIMPVNKSVEAQAALRLERYSDFGNSTTGKLGFTWTPVPSVLLFRGTAATGFRAPSISQISDSYVLSFHSFQERRITDTLRCNSANFSSLANPPVNRDCNVLGFTAVPSGTVNPGSIPTVVAANKTLKPETSRSFTLGMLAQPSEAIDFALDVWYFQRDDEIRVQRGADIMDAYNADRNGPAAAQVIRDPNPQTWLPGVANSGPIILLQRQYGNYKWTKTAGVDYDFTWRLPATEFGKFSVKLVGTYTRRYDRLVLAGAPVDYLAGTSTIDIPKSRGNLTFSWKTDNWSTWLRRNHSDRMTTTTTATCLTSTTVANTFLRDNGLCQVGKDKTVDVGGSYSGFKDLVLTASVSNINNDYGRSNGIPSVFTYWDPGLTASLGRRFNVGATYNFK